MFVQRTRMRLTELAQMADADPSFCWLTRRHPPEGPTRAGRVSKRLLSHFGHSPPDNLASHCLCLVFVFRLGTPTFQCTSRLNQRVTLNSARLYSSASGGDDDDRGRSDGKDEERLQLARPRTAEERKRFQTPESEER